MKTSLLLVTIILLVSCAGQPQNAENNSSKTNAMNESSEALRHVVLLKFKESSTPDEIKEVEDAFLALPSKINEIQNLEWGLNNSPEGINKGFTHCFFLTFASEEDRAVYLPHPAHKAFGEVLSPHLDDVLVVDYWAK